MNPRHLGVAVQKLLLRRFRRDVWKGTTGFRRLSTSCCIHEKLRMSYFHNPGSYPLEHMTVGQLLDSAAEEHPDVECIVDLPAERRFTNAALREEADKMAAGLLELGLKRGDRIVVWGPNTFQWCITYYAAARAGLVLVPINPAYQAAEFRYCLNKVSVKAVVCDHKFKTQDYYKMTLQAAPGIETGRSKQVPSLERVIVMTDEHLPGAIRFQDVGLAGTSKGISEIKDLQKLLQCDEPCNIQYTSGTTGSPKAATLSHHNVINNVITGSKRGNIMDYNRALLVVPLFHCAGNVGLLLGGIYRRHTSVIPSPTFEPIKALQAIESEKCSIIFAVPTMYVDLLSSPELPKYDLSSVKHLMVGAASCPVELMKDMKRKLKPETITSLYGMTETSPVSYQSLPTDTEEILLSTVGYLSDHIEAKVVDNEGRVVPVGTKGELWIRGYVTMLGYWGDDEKTAETISSDRWLRTGYVIHDFTVQ